MLDLNAAGPKILSGSGGGSAVGDPFVQAVADSAVEGAIGTQGSPAWSGIGDGDVIALLKSIAGAIGASSPINGSGTLTAGGVAQTLFGGATPGNGYLVQNLSTAALWVNDLGTASAGAGSIEIPPSGSMWLTPQTYKPGGPISLFGTITGQAFTARYW